MSKPYKTIHVHKQKLNTTHYTLYLTFSLNCGVETQVPLTKKKHPTLAVALHAGSNTGLLYSWEEGAQNFTHPYCPNEEGAKALSSEQYQQASGASLPIALLPISHPPSLPI